MKIYDKEELNEILRNFISELFDEDVDDINDQLLDDDDVERITKFVVHFIYDYCSEKYEGNGNLSKYSLVLDKPLNEIIRPHKKNNNKDIEKLPPNLQELLNRKKEEDDDDDDEIGFPLFLAGNSDENDKETISFNVTKDKTESIETTCPYCNKIKNIGYIKFSDSPYHITECSECNKEYIVHLDFDPKTKIFVEK